MINDITLPQGHEAWDARRLEEINRTDYLFRQVVYVPNTAMQVSLWRPSFWHSNAIRPGFIIDPVFNTPNYRVYFWQYNPRERMFLPVVEMGAKKIHANLMYFFDFFDPGSIPSLFKEAKGIK